MGGILDKSPSGESEEVAMTPEDHPNLLGEENWMPSYQEFH